MKHGAFDFDTLHANLRQFLRQTTEHGVAAGNAVAVGNAQGTMLELYNGSADIERGRPIDEESIYRLFSMTKPITALAAMQLLEQGKIALDDPVCKYISEYAEMTLWKDGRVKRARNTMTLRMLLNMTSGLSYLEEDMDGLQTDLLWRWEQADQAGKPWDTQRVARELAGIPLCFEAGTRFQYGLSLDVMGAVIELVTGKTLEDYCAENIFEPLGMVDTAWRLKPEDADRLALCYQCVDGRLTANDRHRAPVLNRMDMRAPRYFSGGAGALGTLTDYARFARMLLCGGEVDGRRIIGAETLREMYSPQLNPTQRRDFQRMLAGGQGIMHACYSYGYGVRTMTHMLGSRRKTQGEWGWSGAMGTWLTVDPKNGFYLVYMQQRLPSNHIEYIPDLYHAVYSALL